VYKIADRATENAGLENAGQKYAVLENARLATMESQNALMCACILCVLRLATGFHTPESCASSRTCQSV